MEKERNATMRVNSKVCTSFLDLLLTILIPFHCYASTAIMFELKLSRRLNPDQYTFLL